MNTESVFTDGVLLTFILAVDGLGVRFPFL